MDKVIYWITRCATRPIGKWASGLSFFFDPLFIIPYCVHCIHVVLVGSNCTNSIASQQKKKFNLA